MGACFMNMTDMKADLAEWGCDSDMYSDLDRANLEAYYNAAKADQDAATIVADDSESEGATTVADDLDGDDPVESASDGDLDPEPTEEQLRRADVAVGLANLLGSAKASPDRQDVLSGPPGEGLLQVKSNGPMEFIAQDSVAIGESVFGAGKKIKVKDDQLFCVGPKTFEYLNGYRAVKAQGVV